MLGPEPDEDDVEAMLAYLKSLPPPNPLAVPAWVLSADARRGEQLFQSERAGCTGCHSGPYFTDGRIHDVDSGSPDDEYKGFNTQHAVPTRSPREGAPLP